jgi:hypothetical protein
MIRFGGPAIPLTSACVLAGGSSTQQKARQ